MNNKIRETFDKVQAEEKLKDSTRQYLFKKTKGYTKGQTFSYKKFIISMACFIFVLFCAGGYFSYFMPVSAISVDVNPSIELGVNCFDKVISVEGRNEDGNKLASSLDIKFLNYTDALDKMLADESMAYYLSQDEIVSITVMGKNNDKNSEMLASVATCTEKRKNVYCYAANSEQAAAAREAGVSFGKYRAFLELQTLNPNITIEDVKGLTMRQIRNMIDELSGSLNTSENKNGNADISNQNIENGHNGGQGQGLRNGR